MTIPFFYFMDFIIIGLAAWRLSSLLVDEDGPWQVFLRVREKMNVEGCLWCLSIWIGIVLTGIYWYSPQSLWLSWPFALSTVAILINRIV